ncbi:MAG: hypothetical protein P9M14_17315 [Candidatus Alcyoniella australis]|nr:hypothetical protein [Candidatus Alcyoniella australis]
MTKTLIRLSLIALIACALLWTPFPAAAKDLTGRLGVGYNKQISTPFISDDVVALPDYYIATDELSAKFWFTEMFGMNILAGFNYSSYDETKGSNLTLGGKFLANLVQDSWCNFYVGGGPGVSIIHVDDGKRDDTSTGLILMGFGGVEFFFQELPNLGFDLEFGLQYTDVGKYQGIGTYGGGYGTIGFHYYF